MPGVPPLGLTLIDALLVDQQCFCVSHLTIHYSFTFCTLITFLYWIKLKHQMFLLIRILIGLFVYLLSCAYSEHVWIPNNIRNSGLKLSFLS